jgi:hypothetical protein
VLLAAVLSGCVKVHPPPPPPAAVLPGVAQPPSPPPIGHGRVVLDTVDRSSTAYVVEGTAYSTSGYTAVFNRMLCRTPCVVDLPYGQYELRFVAGPGLDASAQVAVAGDKAVRTKLAEKNGGGLAFVGHSLGILGAALGAVGGIGWASSRGDGSDNAEGFGTISLVGVAILGFGVGLWFLDHPSYRPAATTQWNLTAR